MDVFGGNQSNFAADYKRIKVIYVCVCARITEYAHARLTVESRVQQLQLIHHEMVKKTATPQYANGADQFQHTTYIVHFKPSSMHDFIQTTACFRHT